MGAEQFNYLNLPAIDRAAQSHEMNALKIDAAQTQIDESERIANTRWIGAVAQSGIGMVEQMMQQGEWNPEQWEAFAGKVDQEGMRRGVLSGPMETMHGLGPEEAMKGLQGMLQGAQVGLAGMQKPEHYEDVMRDGVLVGQRNAATNKYDPVGATPKGPSAPMQNFAERQRLVTQFGEGSEQVKIFDNYVRSQKVVDIAQVPTAVGPAGNQPLSTFDQEADAAAEMALVEGEAGRGRLQTDGGGFEPVPGSQADIDRREAERKRGGGAFMKSIQSQTVVEDVSRLNTQIEAGEVPFGRAAAIQKDLHPAAQSQGYRAAISLIESVKGNVGIDSLLRIKATGAGLGQVPQSQLDLLSRLLGELDLNQGEDQFVHTWNRMGKIYETIMLQAEDELIELGRDRPDIFSTTPTPTGNTATNPETKERVQEMSDGTWVPIQ